MKHPSFGLTSVLNTAEERLSEYDDHLRSDDLRRAEEAQKQAQALAEAKRLKEEQEAALAAEEAEKRLMYAKLAKEFGHPPPPEPIIHINVSISQLITNRLTDDINRSRVLHVRHLESPAKEWRERPVTPVLGNMGLVP